MAHEGRGVHRNVRRDHLRHAGEFRLEVPTLEVAAHQLVQELAVARVVLVHEQQVVVERSPQHDLARGGSVYRLVDVGRGVVGQLLAAERVDPEGEVVVPRQHGEAPALHVEQVVVARAPQVAVEVHHEGLHGEVAQHLLHVHGPLEVLPGRERPQRADELVEVRLREVEARRAQDVVVERRVVARVAQRNVGILVGQPAVVGLVEHAVVLPEDALGEGVLGVLHGQVEPPRLPVDAHLHEARLGRGHAHERHHVERHVGLEVAVVLERSVQRELVEPQVAEAVLVVVELYLEAVAHVPRLLHEPLGVVALGAQAHAAHRVAVERHVRAHVALLGRHGE